MVVHIVAPATAQNARYLDLHLQVNLEVGQQGEEDGERQLKDFWHRRDAVFGQRHAQILLDGVDEHLMGPKHGAGALQHGQQQLQGHDLRAQLVGPETHRAAGDVSIVWFERRRRRRRSF